MTSRFIDRQEELDFLEKRIDSESFELILIYGRRRVGKTELVKEAVKDQDHIYHLVVEEEGSKQLESLVEDVSRDDSFRPDIDEWEGFFRYFSSDFQQTTLVVDEFPRLVEEDDSIPSRFQKFVDEYLKDSENTLILTGSSIGMMEELMSYENPLYGRRTGQIDLKPFGFRQARKMLSGAIEQKIKYYSIFGGTPFYLNQVEPDKNLKENIRDQICDNNSILNQEPRMLVREEFRKPNRYLSIMESVAEGRTTPKQISDDTNIPLQSISKYLNQLKNIRLLEHEKPVTERNKRSRNGIYRIKDNFFSFWFRYIYPHISDVIEDPDKFVETGISGLNSFCGEKFEQVCRELIRSKDYPKTGRWWYREEEIDIVGLNEKRSKILLGEAKWRKEKTGIKTYHKLKEKSEKVRWKNEERQEKYALFSRSGFTEELREKEGDNLELYDPSRLKKNF
ncbi:MAG: ATP-binding protein [Candidatus Nanohaloarchaea archaeon]